MMSQRALPKVTKKRYISSQWYIPHNVTLKKRQKPSAWPVPAFGWALVISLRAVSLWNTCAWRRCERKIEQRSRETRKFLAQLHQTPYRRIALLFAARACDSKGPQRCQRWACQQARTKSLKFSFVFNLLSATNSQITQRKLDNEALWHYCIPAAKYFPVRPSHSVNKYTVFLGSTRDGNISMGSVWEAEFFFQIDFLHE